MAFAAIPFALAGPDEKDCRFAGSLDPAFFFYD